VRASEPAAQRSAAADAGRRSGVESGRAGGRSLAARPVVGVCLTLHARQASRETVRAGVLQPPRGAPAHSCARTRKFSSPDASIRSRAGTWPGSEWGHLPSASRPALSSKRSDACVVRGVCGSEPTARLRTPACASACARTTPPLACLAATPRSAHGSTVCETRHEADRTRPIPPAERSPLPRTLPAVRRGVATNDPLI
jgi:hypothetical protein